MTNSQRLAKVRARLLQWIADQEPGDSGDDPSTESGTESNAGSFILRESILIRGEFFCGRRFYTANHYAVWFIEEDQLKIYHNNGDLLCILTGSQIEDDHGAAKGNQGPSILKLPNPDAQSLGSQESTRRAA